MSIDKSDNGGGLKLHDLRCFDAVVRTGSFQAAARELHRTHPTVFAAVGRLEARVGFALFDRGGYRVVPTGEGRAFHGEAAALLADTSRLAARARLIAGGAEHVLRVVLGDLCDRARVLPMLAKFFANVPAARLHLDFEAVGGPAERLMDGSADIVFHRADYREAAVERIALTELTLLPVAAAGFLPARLAGDIRPDQLRPFTQCVLRDTARQGTGEDHFLIDGAPRCSVPDHVMKKELILHGLAWGHLPDFMIDRDLAAGRLVRIGGRHFPGQVETLAASRRSDRPHGPVAQRLWQHISASVAG